MGDALYVASRWFLVRAGKIFFPTCSAKNHLLACVHEGGEAIPHGTAPHSLDTRAMAHLKSA